MPIVAQDTQDFWTVGRKPVHELLLARPGQVDLVYVQKDVRSHALARLVDTCKRQRVRFRLVPGRELDRLHSGNHQGVMARVFHPGFASLPELLGQTRQAALPLVLALDQVQDPGNLGVLSRTLLALGGGGLILPKDRTAALGPSAAKASAGALDRLPVTQVVNLSRALRECLDAGCHVYGTTMNPDAENILEFSPVFPAVLVLGNEDKGVRPGVLKHCSARLYIPMPGAVQSLNVAQAGAICLGMFARAKHASLAGA